MTTTALPTTRMFHEVRDQDQPCLDAETLIRETHAVFDQFGVQVSPGRVIKLVRTYVRRVQGNGYDFGHYIATQVAVSETQRKVIADELRKVVSYADPVGERAVNNVLRGAASMNKRLRDLIKDVEHIGYAYDRTNASGTDFYMHEDTGCELRVSSTVDERIARNVMRLARQQVGLPTKDNKRNPAAIRERNACEHERAATELARIQAQRGTFTDAAKTREIEEDYLRAERKFQYWDRLMRGVRA